MARKLWAVVDLVLAGFWLVWRTLRVPNQRHAPKRFGVFYLLPFGTLFGPASYHLRGVPITHLAFVLPQSGNLLSESCGDIHPQI